MQASICVECVAVDWHSSSNTPSTPSTTNDLFSRITRNRHIWKEFNLCVIVDKKYDEEFQELIR